MRRRNVIAGLVAVLCLVLGPPAQAQLTEQPVKIIFPFAAGGSGDAISRLVAEALRVELGRPVIVESRSGAAGRIGVQAAKASPPDGLTLLITPIAPMAVYQHFYPQLGYDPFADFVAVSQIGTFDFSLAVAPNVPAKDLKELVAWVKQDDKRASFGSPGAGTLPHFFGLLFGRAAGLPLQHVNYRGSAAALTDLMGGQLPILVTTTTDLLEAHKAGRIRVLATSDQTRSAFLPEVPNFKEAGYDIVGTGWYGMFAPAGTPAAVVERYSEIVVKALKSPELRAKLVTLGLQPTGTTSAEFAARQKADSALWEPVIKASGFKPEYVEALLSVIARSAATKQSSLYGVALDCFADARNDESRGVSASTQPQKKPPALGSARRTQVLQGQPRGGDRGALADARGSRVS